MSKDIIIIDGVRYHSDRPSSCYGPCVSFCMKKILGYKGEEEPACVRE